jgi:hypothetical protein
MLVNRLSVLAASAARIKDAKNEGLLLVQDLDRGRGHAHRGDLADQVVRDTVEALVDGDVVVDAGLGLAPLGLLVRVTR